MRLNFIKTILFSFSIVLFLASCQKEISIDLGSQNGGGGGTGNNNNIIGDWDYVGMTATTNSSVTVPSPAGELKAVTVSGYTTKNNTGTVNITATEFIFTGMGYTIDTMSNVKTYLNGLLIGDQDVPFTMTSPPTNNTSPYTRINNDSLTVSGSFGINNPSGLTPPGPHGIKIGWSGDTLLLRMVTSFTQSITQGGTSGTLDATLNGIIKLKRR
ncbi:MAG TPA: hypothetical protein VIZ28_14900 [Chitinophagaceae bacterium]